MSASVKSVPNPYFGVSELASFAGSIVSRRRVKIPCNFPTTYSHNGQSQLPYVVRFDISDPENFFDTESLRFSFDFTPLGAGGETGLRGTHVGTQTSLSNVATTANLLQKNTPQIAAPGATISGGWTPEIMNARQWDDDFLPVMDGGYHSFIARIRIGNAQGLLIEENVNYNLWSNVASKLTPKAAIDNDIINCAGDALKRVPCVKQKMLMELKNVSIFKQMRYFPIFLFRSALRIEIEFEDPRLAWYYPKKVISSMFSKESFTTNANLTHSCFMSFGNVTEQAQMPHKANALRLYLQGHKLNLPYIDVFVSSYQGVTGNYDYACLLPLNMDYLTVGANNASGNCFNIGSSWWNTVFGAVEGGNTVVTDVEAILIPFPHAFLAPATPGVGGVYTPLSIVWNYAVENAELIMDYVKPSSEVMVSYINQFNSPSGIPYSYLRSFYHLRIASGGSAQAPLQITLPFSVRSLKAIIVVITDPLSTYVGNDQTIYKFPSLSAFQMRGLREAQLVVGAQQFPAYQLKFDMAGSRGNYVCQQLPELETIAASLFSSGSHTFTKTGLHPYGEDYRDFGFYDRVPLLTAGSAQASFDSVANSQNDPSFGTFYRDTRDFILGFSTQKFDGDFASGIDTTASGSLSLNLTFDQHLVGRDRMIHIWGLADAVFTLQKDASLVRY